MTSGIGTIVRGTGDTETVPVDVRTFTSSVPLTVRLDPALPFFVSSASGQNVPRVFPSEPPAPYRKLFQSLYVVGAGSPGNASLNLGNLANTGPARCYLRLRTYRVGASVATPTTVSFCVIASVDTTQGAAISTAVSLGWIPNATDVATGLYSPYAAWSSAAESFSSARLLDLNWITLPAVLGASDYYETVFDVPNPSSVVYRLWLVFDAPTYESNLSANLQIKPLGE